MSKPAWYPMEKWYNIIEDDSFTSMSRTLVGKSVTVMGRMTVYEPDEVLPPLLQEGRKAVYVPDNSSILPPLLNTSSDINTLPDINGDI